MFWSLLHAFVVAVAVLGVPEATAQQAALCPEPKTQAGFLPDIFLGSWYEMKRVPWDFDIESDGDCGTVRYSWVDESTKSELKIDNTYFMPKSTLVPGYSNRSVSHIMMSAVPNDIANGKLTASFATQTDEEKRLYPAFRYWVLGTDYDSYAVVFSCQEPPGAIVPRINLWVLSKRPSMYTAEVDAKATAVIKAAGLDPSILRPVKHQEGCPSIDRCKECSGAVADLDFSEFKDPWWNVQHSPYADDYDLMSCRSTEFIERVGIIVSNSKIFAPTPEDQDIWETSLSEWHRSGDHGGSFTDYVGGKMCVLGTDYNHWAVVSVCRSAYRVFPVFPMRPFGERLLASEGGVFVLSRKRGLTPEQQLEANKAVVKAGIPVAHMLATPSTPCPKVLLPASDDSARSTRNADSGASATTTPAILLLSALAAVLAHLRPTP